MNFRRAPVAYLAITASVVTACSSGPGGGSIASSPAGGEGAGGSKITGNLMVFAASSLTEAFGTIAEQFEAQHPGTKVRFDFDASSTLAEQITQGAPADVFASASTKNMQQVTQAKDAGPTTNFVKNTLEIAVPPKNPGHIAKLADLARPGVKVALCQPQVPCGAVAQKLFANAGIKVRPATLEADVKSTLAKVELGEVDAGIVYVTDVRAAAGKVDGVRVPASVDATTTYPIATLTHGRNPSVAKAFVQYVLSPAGRKVLTADGFLAP
jgi:molybdate transport system substrate-binding protein